MQDHFLETISCGKNDIYDVSALRIVRTRCDMLMKEETGCQEHVLFGTK